MQSQQERKENKTKQGNERRKGRGAFVGINQT